MYGLYAGCDVSYTFSNLPTWLDTSHNEMIENSALSDGGQTVLVTATVTLDLYPAVTASDTFTVQLLCQVTSISISHPTDMSYNIDQELLVSSQIAATAIPNCAQTATITYSVQ